MVKCKFWGVLMTMVLVANMAVAAEVTRKLPAPNINGGKPLMQAMQERKSIKEFNGKAIDDQTLSEILWSAWGITHDGKRTIPTAKNLQNLKVYVTQADGTWLYDAKDNALILVTKEDLRPLFDQQEYMKMVPLNLTYVGSDEKYSPMHAGSAYQNVGLYAVSKDMHSVVRGYFDSVGMKKALKLESDEFAIISQAIGW